METTPNQCKFRDVVFEIARRNVDAASIRDSSISNRYPFHTWTVSRKRNSRRVCAEELCSEHKQCGNAPLPGSNPRRAALYKHKRRACDIDTPLLRHTQCIATRRGACSIDGRATSRAETASPQYLRTDCQAQLSILNLHGARQLHRRAIPAFARAMNNERRTVAS